MAKISENKKPVLEPFELSLKYIDFKLERLSPDGVEGRFVVSEKSSQPFGVLHGGISALIAEAIASAGALVASNYQRAAGIQLTINHLKAAPIGVEVFASAKPVHVGQRLHVWDVKLSEVKESSPSNGKTIALARVTLMVQISNEIAKDLHAKHHSRL